MLARVQKWGNSLALRIPKAFAQDIHLTSNSLVELSVENGQIVVKPAAPPPWTLDQLLEGITAQNIHGEAETGAATGKEAW